MVLSGDSRNSRGKQIYQWSQMVIQETKVWIYSWHIHGISMETGNASMDSNGMLANAFSVLSNVASREVPGPKMEV